MKYEKFDVPDVPDVRDPKRQYLWCPKHQMVFVEGARCPCCKVLPRNIFDAWEPSVEQDETVKDEYGQGIMLSRAAAAAEQKIPVPGTYRIRQCPLHDMPYIEGLSTCPECEYCPPD